MAKCDIRMPDDFLNKIKNLGAREDEIAETALKAGGEIVLAKAKGNLAASVGRGTKYESRATGELVSALGLSSVKLDRNGNHDIKIGFAEPRSDGGSNAKLANILEYGKHGQPAKPFMKPAKSSAKAAAISAMQKAFEEAVDKI